MKPADTPLEQDLHALADQRLDPEAAAKVERWLADHPGEAGRLRDWQRQNEQLHAAYDPVLDQTIPNRLIRAAKGRGSHWRRLRIAAAFGWVVLGVVIGLGVPKIFTAGFEAPASRVAKSNQIPAFPGRAAVAHAVFSPEQRHPVEVGIDQEAHLVQWLSKRTGVALKAPNLLPHGFSLMGGRLLPGESGPAAQFMYEDLQGQRVTLLLGRDPIDRLESPANSTAFRFINTQGVSVFYWVDGEVNYALSGSLPRDTLLALAESAFRALTRKDDRAL
jgi:anti-sigma factor RsiW